MNNNYKILLHKKSSHKIYQLEISVLFKNFSLLTPSQGQVIMAVDGLQDPYLEVFNLVTPEHLNIYKEDIFDLPEIKSYDLTMVNW